jgi:hypothetical protein
VTEPVEGAEPAGPGTLALWFWGTLLAFGIFLVALPGQDPRARFWWWAGVVLAVLSVVALVRALLGRRQRHQS